VPASAAAVIDGCLVARVNPRNWIKRKLPAYRSDDSAPSTNSGNCPHLIKNRPIAVPAVITPPPAAEPSMRQYSRRLEVT
jgi:hypothetical protein